MTNPFVLAAQQAVDYTRARVPNTWNRKKDFELMVADKKAANQAEALQKLNVQREERRKDVHAIERPKMLPTFSGSFPVFLPPFVGFEPPELLDGDDVILHSGMLAEQHQTGNCGELAAVAYSYLRRRQIPGVLYVGMLLAELEVHLFVVIAPSSGAQPSGALKVTSEQAGELFANDAVICDPWLGDRGEVFEMSQWVEAVKQMSRECHWNGSDAIKFRVLARASTLTREQKEHKWRWKGVPLPPPP